MVEEALNSHILMVEFFIQFADYIKYRASELRPQINENLRVLLPNHLLPDFNKMVY
jgi:hypothetical protein